MLLNTLNKMTNSEIKDYKSMLNYYKTIFNKYDSPFKLFNTKIFKGLKFRYFDKITYNKNFDLDFMRDLFLKKLQTNDDQNFFKFYFRLFSKNNAFYNMQVGDRGNFIKIDYSDSLITNANYIIFFVTIVKKDEGHSNLLFYNTKTCVIEQYEPHGYVEYEIEELKENKRLIKNILKLYNFPVSQYYSTALSCHVSGSQANEEYSSSLGLCLYWSFLTIEMKLNNQNCNLYEIQTTFDQYLKHYNYLYVEYISEYFLFFHNLIYRILSIFDDYCQPSCFPKFSLKYIVRDPELIKCAWKCECKVGIMDLYSDTRNFIQDYLETQGNYEMIESIKYFKNEKSCFLKVCTKYDEYEFRFEDLLKIRYLLE
jgi:hypothetical protein